jgi:hypothetical protein
MMPIPDDAHDALKTGGVVRLDMITRPGRALRITGRALLPVLLDGRTVELDVIVAAGPNGGRCLISDDPALGTWLAAAG